MQETQASHAKTTLRSLVLMLVLLTTTFISKGIAGARQTGAIQLPDGFVVDTVANNFEWPTAFSFLPD
ncbi:MAG TPA: hypothetical protein VGK87_16885 [Anaerolineae bacterium]